MPLGTFQFHHRHAECQNPGAIEYSPILLLLGLPLVRPWPRFFPSGACLANEVKTEVTDLCRSSFSEVLVLLARCLYAHPAALCSTFCCPAFQRKARLCRRGDAQRRACRPRDGSPAPTNSVMEHGASHGNSCLAGATFRHGFGAAVPRRN